MSSDPQRAPGEESANTASAQQPRGLRAWLKHAFAIEKYDESSLEAEEKEVLQALAERIHRKSMTAAAIIFMQSGRNLNFVTSSVMIATEPLFEHTHPLLNGLMRHIGLNVPPEDYPKLYRALEKRYSIEYLIQRLEALEAGQ